MDADRAGDGSAPAAPPFPFLNRTLACLALGTFTVGTGIYGFTGTIDSLADDLGVSVGAAGQIVTVFAVAYALSSPFLVTLTSRLDRRRVLTLAMALFAVANVAAALAPGYLLLCVARVLGGVAAAIYMPVATAAAGALAPPQKRGVALAAVTSGLIVAFIVGVPAGTVLGDAFGWRASFWLAAALGMAGALALTTLPHVPAPQSQGLRALRVAARPAVAQILVLTVLGFAAMFVVVGYIAPLLTAITGFTGRSVGILQSIVGVGGLLGAAAGGAVADRGASSRAMSVLFGIVALGLIPYSLLAAFGTPGSTASIAAAMATVFVGNAALFALVPLQQYRLLRAAPDEANTALAINASAIFLGQGAGTVLGGVVLGLGGLSSLGWTGALCALAGAGVLAIWKPGGEARTSESLAIEGRSGLDARVVASVE